MLASPLLQRSPHVLYTNVVEPILRWMLASKGYALVHAACFADGDQAVMLTARTDTGKTTTALKLLDHSPYSFLSDDLTIVCPDGRVLGYPKPLTISRHTLHAVRRRCCHGGSGSSSCPQSRLHSRTGRRFAFVLAKHADPGGDAERGRPAADSAAEVRHRPAGPDRAGGARGEDRRDGRDRARPRPQDRLDRDEAMEILFKNCEDAFGFPPYSEIVEFLHGLNGHDLKRAEREVVESAFASVPATLIASSTMDWWRQLPSLGSVNVRA